MQRPTWPDVCVSSATAVETPRHKSAMQSHTKASIDLSTLPDALQRHVLGYIQRFPRDEIIQYWNLRAYMMRPFNTLACVCRRWHSVIQPLISASRHVYSRLKLTAPEDLDIEYPEATQVLHLDLVLFTTDLADVTVWRRFFHQFPQLRRLDLCTNEVDITYETALLEAAPLASLQAFDITLDSAIQTKSVLAYLESTSMGKLKTLIIRKSGDSEGTAFNQNIFRMMPNLERFVISVDAEHITELETIAQGLIHCTLLKEYVQFLPDTVEEGDNELEHPGRVCRILATHTPVNRIIMGARYHRATDDESVKMLIRSIQDKRIQIDLCGPDGWFEDYSNSHYVSCKAIEVLGAISSPIKGGLLTGYEYCFLNTVQFTRDDLVSMALRRASSFEVYYRDKYVQVCTDLFTLELFNKEDVELENKEADNNGGPPFLILRLAISPPRTDPILGKVSFQVSQPSGPIVEMTIPGNWEDILLHANPLPVYMTQLLVEQTIESVSYSKLRVVASISKSLKTMDVDAWASLVDVPFVVSLLNKPYDHDSMLIVRNINGKVTVLELYHHHGRDGFEDFVEEYFGTVFQASVTFIRRWAYRYDAITQLEMLVAELQSGGSADRFFDMPEWPPPVEVSRTTRHLRLKRAFPTLSHN